MLKLVIFLTTRIYDCSLARQLCLSRFSFSQLGSMTAHFSTIMLKLVLFLTTRTYDRSLGKTTMLKLVLFLTTRTTHYISQSFCPDWVLGYFVTYLFSHYYYWKKIQSFLSNQTKINISIRPVKIVFVYQSASLLAQEIFKKLKKKNSFW